MFVQIGNAAGVRRSTVHQAVNVLDVASPSEQVRIHCPVIGFVQVAGQTFSQEKLSDINAANLNVQIFKTSRSDT